MRFLFLLNRVYQMSRRKLTLIIFFIGAVFLIVMIPIKNQMLRQEASLSENVTFAATGHVYANKREFEYILDDLRRHNISTLFVGGDIEDTILNKISDYEKQYHLHIVVSPGNHEIQGPDSASSFYKRFGTYHYLKQNDLNIIVLNSMLAEDGSYPHSGAGISDMQFTFLKDQLEKLKDEPVIILMHHALWAPDLTKEELQKMAQKSGLSEGIDIGKIQFPANDTAVNDWMKDVHPLLVKHGNVHVFAGDASLTTILEKDGVNYYTTGLRQPTKEVWVKDKLQSYLQCNQAQRDIYCDIVFFDKDKPQPAATASNQGFTSVISKLIMQPSVNMTMDLAGKDIFDELSGVTYLTVEKNENACAFPEYGLVLTGEGVYEKGKGFLGIDLSPSKRLYFIQSHPAPADTIKKLQYYLFQNPGNLCDQFTVHFYTADFNNFLQPLRDKVDTYSIRIEDDEYDTLLKGIPDESEDRYNSNFQFPSVKAELTYQNTIYDMKIKNRGGTSHHWANDKKSYTVNFKDFFKHNDKLLFYIPDKRAYTGEYLINELAHEMNLAALNSGFAELSINGENHGMYYVSEDFDNLFLAKRDLPEANIYNTDPYKNPDQFTTEALPKEMILSTLKDYEDAYDHDADYFLSVIKKDLPELTRNWEYYFDPDNLSKILALSTLSGTAHYDFHNIVFYINPADGRISFFPWDFMNYTHVGDLQREDLKGFPNDYLNVNPLFSKLLKIPEIRNMRNKVIYDSGDILIKRLNQFEETEQIGLITDFMADPTTTYYVGDGNKPSFVTYLHTPSIIKSNIQYIKNKIETVSVTGYVDTSGTIFLQSDSFNSIRVKRILISGIPGDAVQSVQVNTIPLAAGEYTVQQGADGSQEIVLQTDVALSPTLTYKDEFATPIYLDPGYMRIDLQTNGAAFFGISVEVENPATSQTQILPLSFRNTFIPGPSPQVPAVTTPSSLSNPLLQSIDSRSVTFARSEVEITKDLVIPKGMTLHIQPGTRVAFAEKASLISYGGIIAKGTKDDPITFTALDPDKPWGVVGLAQQDASGDFEYCIFENGNDAYTKNDIYFSGMLSSYYGNLRLVHSIIRNGNSKSGDDGVNVKYSRATITHNLFSKNKFDALDLDFVNKKSIVENNTFENNGNDGMDISGTSGLIIKNNTIRKSGDKGISVGEKSDITILNNTIEETQMGIAVKDTSVAHINHNNITKNKVGVAAYNKKELFGGGTAKIYNSLFTDNTQDFGTETIGKRDFRFLDTDYLSQIEVLHSSYKISGKETQELIKESTKKNISKKDMLKLYLSGNISEYTGTYATLKDTAARMSTFAPSDISDPIGIQ